MFLENCPEEVFPRVLTSRGISEMRTTMSCGLRTAISARFGHKFLSAGPHGSLHIPLPPCHDRCWPTAA